MTMVADSFLYNVEILCQQTPEVMSVLTPGALEFIVQLQRQFNHTRKNLLDRRRQVQAQFDAGALPDFLSDTIHIQQTDWTIAPPPADLRDRCVESGGPLNRHLIPDAVNDEPRVFLADFDDASAPTWNKLIQGQLKLRDAVRGNVASSVPAGKYRRNFTELALVVRPRGWHAEEAHLSVDGDPMSATLFDVGLTLYHNAQTLLDQGSSLCFDLPESLLENGLRNGSADQQRALRPSQTDPKIKTDAEARLWNDVFAAAEQELDIPGGAVRVTMLAEASPV